VINLLIVGYGFVGRATEYMLRHVHDPDAINIQIQDPAKGYKYPDDFEPEFSFICVPTPRSESGAFDISILKEAYEVTPGQRIIRCTIGPDQISEFPQAIFLPEFLREKHWKHDSISLDYPLVCGVNPSYVGRYRALAPRVSLSYAITGNESSTTRNIVFTTPEEAVMFKLARNSLLAARVALANELYEMCKEIGIDYNGTFKNLLKNDKDLGGTHYDVPGHDGKMGFGGNCLPKDLSHLSSMSDVAFLFKEVYNSNMSRRSE
jgi:UDPglucose 6-dehydrogenase